VLTPGVKNNTSFPSLLVYNTDSKPVESKLMAESVTLGFFYLTLRKKKLAEKRAVAASGRHAPESGLTTFRSRQRYE